MKAYRLQVNKCEDDFIEAGLTLEQANKIIDDYYEVDEDFISKREYIARAKYYQAKIKEDLGIEVDWKVLFGEPESYGYRYCPKCGEFYWENEECGCGELD